MSAAVQLAAAALNAWPALPASAPAGSVWVDDVGVVVLVLEDGSAEQLREVPLRRSIAADPCARRR